MTVPFLLAMAAGCSEYDFKEQPSKPFTSEEDPDAQDDGAVGDDGTDAGGSGDGGSGGSDADGSEGGGDSDGGSSGGGTGGGTTVDPCDTEYHDLTGTYDFESMLHMDDALDGWIGWIADASDDVCSWTSGGPISGAPAWISDLFCLVDDALSQLKDIQVEYTASFTENGYRTWDVDEDWKIVTMDPSGAAVTVSMSHFECPMDMDSYVGEYECDSRVSFDEHDLDLPINGLIQLVLDGAACGAMDDDWGCSWDSALDEACNGIDDFWLELACEELVSSLVLPDPCADLLPVSLSGDGTVTWPSSGPKMSGTWDGEYLGEGIPGTFQGEQR